MRLQKTCGPMRALHPLHPPSVFPYKTLNEAQSGALKGRK